MKITALVEALVAAGATPEMILAAVRTTESENEAALETAREKTRARVEKWRVTRAVTLHTGVVAVGNGSRGGATRVEDKPLPQKIEPQESKKESSALTRDVSDFREALAELDPERLDALLKHRRSKRGSVTGHAARLFIRDAVACGLSLVEATDTCISRNWITVRPEYLVPKSRGSPAQSTPQLADVFYLAGQEFEHGKADQNRERSRPAIPHLPVVRTG